MNFNISFVVSCAVLISLYAMKNTSNDTEAIQECKRNII